MSPFLGAFPFLEVSILSIAQWKKSSMLRMISTKRKVFIIFFQFVLKRSDKCLIDLFSTLKGLFNNKYLLQKNIDTGCPKKHGNSVTNWISFLLWISIVMPNFKRHNIIMSARVYFKERVKDCKDVSIMFPQDEQWIRTSLLCIL